MRELVSLVVIDYNFISILLKYDFNGELFIRFEWEVVFFSNFATPGTRAADVQYNSTGVRAPVYNRIKEQAYVYLVRVGQLYRKPATPSIEIRLPTSAPPGIVADNGIAGLYMWEG